MVGSDGLRWEMVSLILAPSFIYFFFKLVPDSFGDMNVTPCIKY